MELLNSSSLKKKQSYPQKKRTQYKWISNHQKRDLIFRAIYLNENLKEICKDLGINFMTGRNLVQHYKKTGQYCLYQKAVVYESYSTNLRMVTKDTQKKFSGCPLGIMSIDDDNMKLVGSKIYTQEDEATLMKLHSFFINQCIV